VLYKTLKWMKEEGIHIALLRKVKAAMQQIHVESPIIHTCDSVSRTYPSLLKKASVALDID
ncbi:MAG: hypothetical protein J0651_04455, partial [Actinobacteria bacterium]|nr:hypothetical protein [Actinomycetota bacterium]